MRWKLLLLPVALSASLPLWAFEVPNGSLNLRLGFSITNPSATNISSSVFAKDANETFLDFSDSRHPRFTAKGADQSAKLLQSAVKKGGGFANVTCGDDVSSPLVCTAKNQNTQIVVVAHHKNGRVNEASIVLLERD